MSNTSSLVRDHYQSATEGDIDGLLARLDMMVDQIEGPVTAGTLARLDQFHFGGLAATVELAGKLGLGAQDLVLDAGSGFGGPSRYLAETFACRVVGIDLAPDFVAVARLLTDRAGLSDHVSFRVGDLTDLPLDDASFDVVWTQHVVMNVRDRARLYCELRRVLKPGGRLAFFDPVAGEKGAEPFYPVPWAATHETSTLLTESETVAALTEAGFSEISLDDFSTRALGWAAQSQTDPSPVTLSVIVGPRMAEMAANFGRSIREGRVRLLMGVFNAA